MTEQTLQKALQAHQQGRLEEAQTLYEEVLQHSPDHSAALSNLASLHTRRENFAAAQACYQRVLQREDAGAQTWFNYGNLQQRLHQPHEAEQSFTRALALQPNLLPARFNLANLLLQLDRLDEAATHFEEALRLQPSNEQARSKLATLLRKLGDRHYHDDDAAGALALYQRIEILQPEHADLCNAMAVTLNALGRATEAEVAWRRALRLDPSHATALANLGTLYRLQKRHDDALQHLRRAVEVAPQDASSAASLASTLIELGAVSEALTLIDRVAIHHPQHAELLSMRAFGLVQQARIDEAQQVMAQVRELRPGNSIAIPNSLFSSLYSDSLDAAALTHLHRELCAPLSASPAPANASALTSAATPTPRRPSARGKPLRIGYLSPDLRAHPVGFFIEPVLQHHDRKRFSVTCYALSTASDEHTRKLQSHGHGWHNCSGWNQQRLAQQIRADGIDVLVDLTGHTAGGRPLLLAARAAPVQAVFIGYPYTTGLPSIDYIVADQHLIPVGQEALYSERPARLPHSFLLYQPQPGTPPVAALPSQLNGHITFGSFNNLPKVSATCLDLWARVLQAVPNSRMVLMASSLADAGTRTLFQQHFVSRGITADRVDLLPPVVPLTRFLAEYARLDIALDSLPYNGGTTTCDALWMGVPVVTLAGEGFMSRMGVSLLNTVGHPEWVAATPDDYVQIATALAADRERLAMLRAGLRSQVMRSGLCDGKAYTQGLETLYRQWCTDAPRQEINAP